MIDRIQSNLSGYNGIKVEINNKMITGKQHYCIEINSAVLHNSKFK